MLYKNLTVYLKKNLTVASCQSLASVTVRPVRTVRSLVRTLLRLFFRPYWTNAAWIWMQEWTVPDWLRQNEFSRRLRVSKTVAMHGYLSSLTTFPSDKLEKFTRYPSINSASLPLDRLKSQFSIPNSFVRSSQSSRDGFRRRRTQHRRHHRQRHLLRALPLPCVSPRPPSPRPPARLCSPDMEGGFVTS